MRGLVIAAPASGSGKTTVTLGLLAALKARGLDVVSAKSGPDYIDPAFHAAATGRPCVTLDPWAAEPGQIRARARRQSGSHLVVEGAMGLFDGAPEADHPLGRGSTADVAAALGLPVMLVLDAARMGQGAAAIAAGVAGFREDVHVAGVILNRLGGARHERIVRAAVETVLPVVGALPVRDDLALPSRHLGLVQAGERDDLAGFIAGAAEWVAAGCDLDAILADAAYVHGESGPPAHMEPLGQRIAVARDLAFGFAYAHMLDDWRALGAEVSFFSPLADEAPDPAADAVFLPGGYPELHAGRLAAAERVPRRHGRGCRARGADLWRVRRLHGAGRRADRRRRRPAQDAGAAEAGDQLRAPPEASRLSPAHHAGRAAVARGAARPRVPLRDDPAGRGRPAVPRP